jgi:predicted flap endonuclease-1-like 5' DNA nuclease
MLWLIWQIWIFLFIAFGLGLALGWRLWSASGETGKALQDANEQIGRLQRENDSLTRLVAQGQADREKAGQAKPASAATRSGSEPVKTGAAAKSATAPKPASTKTKATRAKSSAAKQAGKKAPASKPAAKSKPAKSKPDDLTELKGVGPKAAKALNAEGVTTFAQIAAWSKSDIERWDEKLTARGRITRDDWVGQAKAKAG